MGISMGGDYFGLIYGGGTEIDVSKDKLDRYETLVNIRKDNLIKNKYTIFERDRTKGTRITIVDSLTASIIREIK